MNRDHRAYDNWALLYAAQLAEREGRGLTVIFCVAPAYLGATLRQYDFMLRGLVETETLLREYRIPLVVLSGDASDVIPAYVEQEGVGAVVGDFSPLRLLRKWRELIAEKITCPFYEVDAHNIVPCWIASPKQEYGAYTFRPKINRLLPQFLTSFPKLPSFSPSNSERYQTVEWKNIFAALRVDTNVKPVQWIVPGRDAASACLKNFIENNLAHYHEKRNDPNARVQSNLSPYLHYGQIAPQRIALEILKLPPNGNTADFLEELIVRRELADNFCYYEPHYDSPIGFPDWAKKTLAVHAADKRDYVYTLDEFERGVTHDELWNAAQIEMKKIGKMAGYLRMYWAKKILEWTRNAATAMGYALYLNDKYELDGRDPTGYAGIGWSIGGVHDRAWFSRPIFGTVRYMNARGAAGKFDVRAYIDYVDRLTT